MYNILSQFSSMISQPFLNMASTFEHFPILFALLLGVVGALVPCQLTANISAVTIYGNQSLQNKVRWKELSSFVLGKVVAFSLLGVIVWVIGTDLQNNLTFIFPWIRKLIGPLLIFVGLVLIGVFKWNRTFHLWKKSKATKQTTSFGAFFLGFSFSLAFCPTMFVIYFLTLIPLTFITPYGFLLPSVFAIGTAIPLIVFILLIWSLGGEGWLLKKGRSWGTIVQKTGGGLLILIGVFDTITYW
ncbi:MAG: sulfite exporter TauE/SafE family protein [Bacillaceae bacterium]|nr:sulfite exporter TauE/SafE family protein [Bacillaceae bacterium]